MDVFGIPLQVVLGQTILGLINGGFYALLSIGLAVTFGLLNIANFAHGALYMLGAFITWILLRYLGIGYWPALVITPLVVGLLGVALERTLIARLYGVDPVYGILLTFGIALVLQGLLGVGYGASAQPYAIPESLVGSWNVGFMFLPKYRAWVVVAALGISLATWVAIERTELGARLRAGTENPELTEAFGINVLLMKTLVFGAGAALAAFAGTLAAPIYSVSPLMGADLIIVVFAVVVVGGTGSVLGAIVTGFSLGIVEGLTKTFYPQFASTIVFVVMIGVLLVRPAGLFGKEA